jgi:putative transposase
VIVAFVDEHRNEFGVEFICRHLQVAPSTYYAAKRRQAEPSARAKRDAALMPILLALWVANRKVYGAHKLWKAARRAGNEIGRDQVGRLMRELEIRGVSRMRNKVFTTRQDPDAWRAPDLVNRDFTADRPDALWVTDLTYVPTRSGMAYVCFIVDAFSRRIVGWRVASNMRTEMVLDALEMARVSRGARRLVGLVTHSDAGSQGGLKWSSQHLDMEVVRHHVQARASGGSPRDAGEGLVAGAAVDGAARAPDRLLEGDRTRVVERGRCGRGRHGIRVRGPVVPGGWRHAASQAGRALGPLPVLRGT